MVRELTKHGFFKLIVALVLAILINMTPATLLHGEYSPAAARIFPNTTEPEIEQTTSKC